MIRKIILGVLKALIIFIPFIPGEVTAIKRISKQDSLSTSIGRLKVSFSPLKYTWYNRVDGAFLGFKSRILIPQHLEYSVVVSTGYSFMTHKPRYGVAFTRTSGEKLPFTFSLDYQDETARNDEWTVSRLENTLAAFLSGRDFWDYFGLRTGGLTIAFDKFRQYLFKFRAEIRSYQPLSQGTSWNLIGENHFRPNPQVVSGTEAHLAGEFQWDTRNSTFFPGNAWYFSLMTEKGFHDFSYSGMIVQAKRYQMIFGMQRLVARALLRTRQGTRARQFLFDLGGPGTLRGFAAKEFTGNRFFVANLDYFFGGSLLKKLPFDRVPLYNGLNLVLFADAGSAAFADDSEFFLKDIFIRAHPALFSDAGFGFSFAQDILRFDCARRLDRGSKVWVYSLRINQRL